MTSSGNNPSLETLAQPSPPMLVPGDSGAHSALDNDGPSEYHSCVMERRLAAILAADVVGYSRLMGEDEAGTLEALKSRRKTILEPRVREHGGRIVKVMGDGVLVAFPSAVNAVECAIALQQSMAEADSGIPEERRIVLRIGVNLGDLIVEGGDLYGDGVNVAARLEALAEPGGICISGTVHDHVKAKLKLAYDDLGAQSLKNIAEPVRVYRVQPGTAKPAQAPPLPLPTKPSIAVLPFESMSDDPEQVYFSDGITEDIITELSRFRELSVTARNSSFQFRERSIDITEIGRRLGVQFILEGSLRKAGNRIRITAQLIDAGTGNHIWAERYDRNLEDIFGVQDELVRTIVGTLAGRLEDATIDAAKRKPTDSLLAYDCVLRATEELRAAYGDAEIYAKSGTTSARAFLEKAIGLDPNYARAHAALAFAHVVDWSYLGQDADVERSYANARKAVALDPHDNQSQLILGLICSLSKRYAAASVHIERALAINPNDPEAISAKGVYLDLVGKHDESVILLREALRLNPYQRDHYMEDLGFALYSARRYEEAAEAFNSIDKRPHWIHALVAACYAMLGRLADAQSEARLLMPWPAPWDKDPVERDAEFPQVPKALIAYVRCYRNPEDFANWIDGFRKAGVLM